MPPEEEGKLPTTEAAGETSETSNEQDDALWNEVASEREDPPADEAAGDANPDPADQKEPVDANAGSDPDSAENKEAAGDDPPASQASSDDIWADAPPHLKAAHEAAVEALETKFQSVKGRLSVQDRLLDALRKGKGAKAKAILDGDEFKALKQEYGDNLKPLVSAVESLVESQVEMDGAVDAANEELTQTYLDEQASLYKAAHPDWASYAQDDRFAPWLSNQPRHVREAAARNQRDIVDASEASDVLARFKAAHGIGVTPKPPAPPPPAEDRSEDERRNRQRDGGRASGVRGGPATTATDPEDPEALWDAIATKRDRQRQINR